ncbi:MAG TPA: glycoside hydrolase family 16 protein, partial [Terriglobales bacterium]|nr:glycoside hydrolase family 16 protein [Terriglobales bacterium]
MALRLRKSVNEHEMNFLFRFILKRHLARIPLAFLLLLAVCLNPSSGFANIGRPVADQSPWKLVWSDEFNGRNGSAADPAKWVLETGGSGWGNNELETYTNRLNNAHMENGALAITALQENFKGRDNIARNYTSARLKTKGKFSLTYGRVEARIKIPYGQGLWPAFW